MHCCPAGAPASSGSDGCLACCTVSFQHFDELLKADICIVGAWGGLRVVLDAHGLSRRAQQASAGAIVQVDVRHGHVRRQRCRVDRIVVVLRADLDAACTEQIGSSSTAQPPLNAVLWPVCVLHVVLPFAYMQAA